MSINIGHASIDENGKISGGKTGDQTGKEICIRKWYNKPWNVFLVCTDIVIASKAAKFMELICKNPSYGYNQSQRTSGYDSILTKGIPEGRGSFDCSSLVSTCYKLAGLNISVHNTTASLRKALLSTGKFKAFTDKSHIATDDYAMPGSIYLSEGKHVVMALEKGNKVNPYQMPKRNINIGCKGDDVKWVQWELLYHGYRFYMINGKKEELTVDGSCGKITEAAIKAYQTNNKLKVDGDCGPITRESIAK